MRLLNLLLITLFNFFYCICNYNFSILFVITFIVIEVFSIIILKNVEKYFNLKRLMICIFMSVLTLCLFPNNFLYGYNDKEIIINNNNINVSLYLDDVKQKISNDSDELLTDYKILNKLSNNYYNSEESIIITTNKKHKIRLEFEKTHFTETVFINGEKIVIPQKENYESSFMPQWNHYYYLYDIDNLNKFNWYLCMASFIYLTIMFYSLTNKSQKLLFLCLILWEFSGLINLDVFDKFLVFFLSFLSLKSINEKSTKLLIFPSIIITFCLGGNLFIDNFNLSLLVYFSLMCYVIFYFLNVILENLNKIRMNKSNTLKKHNYILFFVIFSILIMYKFIIGDCFVHPDGLMQLEQISGHVKLNTWHPFMHTLFIKLLNFNSVDGFVYFRILIISFIVVWILNYWRKKGLSLKLYYFIGILFALFPTNILYIMTLTKDVEFAIFLIVITQLICEIILENKLSFPQLIMYFICLSALFYFRHNGIISFIGLFILLVIILRKKIKLIVISSVIFIIIILLKLVLFNIYDVEDKKYNFALSTMAHGLDYLYIDNKLSPNDYIYLQSIMNDNAWKSGYNKYNIDVLIHYNTGNFLQQDIDYMEFFFTYLKNIFKHPIYLLKDRLYGTDILWNVFNSDYISNYRYHILYDEYDNNWVNNKNIDLNENVITIMLHKIILFIGSNTLLDAIFFRGGLYFIISVFLAFYIFAVKNKRLLFAFLPMLLNNLSLFLAMHHQSYRYVVYMPFICFILLMASIFCKNDG